LIPQENKHKTVETGSGGRIPRPVVGPIFNVVLLAGALYFHLNVQYIFAIICATWFVYRVLQARIVMLPK